MKDGVQLLGAIPKWQRPELYFSGSLDEIVQQGNGKCTFIAGDPGESRKPAQGGADQSCP